MFSTTSVGLLKMRKFWIPVWFSVFLIGRVCGMEIYSSENSTIDTEVKAEGFHLTEDIESKLFILHPVDSSSVQIGIDYITLGSVKIFTADQLLKWDKNYVTLTSAFSNKLSNSIMYALDGISLGLGGPNALGNYLQCYSNILSQILSCK